jgi:hypothetical protein
LVTELPLFAGGVSTGGLSLNGASSALASPENPKPQLMLITIKAIALQLTRSRSELGRFDESNEEKMEKPEWMLIGRITPIPLV